ncbi:hypothetical protein QBC38DRAFT_486600 [Podospora fimiseda]|uniref:Uncharacterized protein n=1 Tax=Podospora fimiseda TaxID=252190 RepID=A0AAN7GT44_9PEZI|nr:hypothetical protein QBC38DRAFT_486600 [Podospora fimiseda]
MKKCPWLQKKFRKEPKPKIKSYPPLPTPPLPGPKKMIDMIVTEDDLARLDIVHGYESDRIGDDNIVNPRYYAGVGARQRVLLITMPAKGAGDAWTPERLLDKEQNIIRNREKDFLDDALYSEFTCENYTLKVYILPGDTPSYSPAIKEMYGNQLDFGCLAFTYNPCVSGSYEEMVSNFYGILERSEDYCLPLPAIILAIKKKKDEVSGAGAAKRPANMTTEKDMEMELMITEKEIEINLENGEEFAEKMNCEFFECCGETGKNITKGFWFQVVRESHKQRVLWEGRIDSGDGDKMARDWWLRRGEKLVEALFGDGEMTDCEEKDCEEVEFKEQEG